MKILIIICKQFLCNVNKCGKIHLPQWLRLPSVKYGLESRAVSEILYVVNKFESGGKTFTMFWGTWPSCFVAKVTMLWCTWPSCFIAKTTMFWGTWPSCFVAKATMLCGTWPSCFIAKTTMLWGTWPSCFVGHIALLLYCCFIVLE